MDFNNTKSRLERLYSSIDARFDDDIEKNTKITHKTNGKKGEIRIDFGYEKNDAENKILTIVHNLSNLKDNLIDQVPAEKENIENEINKSTKIKIAIDLANAEKHGYPTKSNKSGLHPRIKNISSALSTKKIGKVSFAINLSGQVARNEDGFGITLNCDIVNLKGKLIMNLDELVDGALADWKKIITKYSLN